MVGFAVRGWPIAVGPDAPAIPGGEGPVLRCGEQSLRLAVVKYLTPIAKHGGGKRGVAAQLRHGRSRDGLVDAVDPTHTAAGFEVVEGDVDVDGGGGAVDAGHVGCPGGAGKKLGN